MQVSSTKDMELLNLKQLYICNRKTFGNVEKYSMFSYKCPPHDKNVNY